MSSSRFFKFFASDRGRNFALGSTAVAAMGSALINFLPHTFFVDKHRDLTSSYNNGVLRQTPETIKKKYELALELLKVSDFDRNFLKAYMVFGFDTYSIGSTKFKYGALTGIPTNYMYTSPNDIERGEITIRGQKVNWSSEGGKNLEQALVLTDDEQVFGIAREIIQLQTQKVLLNSIFPCASIVGIYTMGHALNTKLLLLQRPFSVRGFLYVIVGLFGYGMYCLMTDVTQVRYDSETDEVLANLGEDFIQAGIRFYDKLLKKNMAIRQLTNDTSFTALGNENFLIRHKTLPLTFRKAYFEQKLKELQALKQKTESEQQ